DYCCVHAAMALREDGYETIMVNCNPETVSTDYDTSDRLYFEPVTLEDVLEIINIEKPEGVIVQYGGQTPLKLARALEANGVKIIGTTPDSIDIAEDRERFQHLLQQLGLRQPPNRTARTEDEAIRMAEEIGYPLVVRPSYVLGGRAMDIVHERSSLERYMREAIKVTFDSPVLLDRFLDDAVEMDIDAVSDGNEVRIGGVMQHIEQAGVHSGDSACSIPPYSLDPKIVEEVKRQTRVMAKALNVVGLMNVQFAIQNAFTDHPEIYVLEVNPRASRTVPFVSKSTGQQLAKIAARCMVGQTLEEQGKPVEVELDHYSVKEAVFPFAKFLGVDPVLGPEMRSTGEVMGVGQSFGQALFKSQLGADSAIPRSGTVFISVKDSDKPRLPELARQFTEAGYKLVATRGTAKVIQDSGYKCEIVNKVSEGRPNVVDELKNGTIQMVIAVAAENTTEIADASAIRIASLSNHVTFYTAMANALAVVEGIRHMHEQDVYSLQELHKDRF
ncbi:carbamoyl-phosphate synthase large subunit, partial [Turicimonas muris]